MARLRRPRRRHLDREHEHRAGRQQETVPGVRRDHPDVRDDDDDVRGGGPRGGEPRHGVSLRDDLHGTHELRLAPRPRQLVADSLPAFLGDAERNAMRSMFDAVPGMDGVLFFIRKQLKETVRPWTRASSRARSTSCPTRCFGAVLRRDEALGQDPLSDEEAANARACAASLWAFSIIWSICASVTGEGRPSLTRDVRPREGREERVRPALAPASKGECYDVRVLLRPGDEPGLGGVDVDTQPEYVVDPEKPFAEVIVPTADTVRYTFVIDACS